MEKINYKEIISKYPWVVEKDHNAILSPDTNGLLCGLLMSNYLNWKVAGFYDGKVLKIKKGISVKDCIFLDMEILRENIRSLGHHINIHNFNTLPSNYHKIMNRCINPNYIRGFDRAHYFPQKYPLGSVHFLLFLLDEVYPDLIKIKKEGLGTIFFADGIWKILFKYTDNFLDWFQYLDVDEKSDWWLKLQQLSVIDLIKEIDALINKLKDIHPEKKKWYGHINISILNKQKGLALEFLNLLGLLTGWHYNYQNWNFDNLDTYNFTKKIYDRKSRDNEIFLKIWKKKPLSLAMTEGSTIQYTLERPDEFPL